MNEALRSFTLELVDRINRISFAMRETGTFRKPGGLPSPVSKETALRRLEVQYKEPRRCTDDRYVAFNCLDCKCNPEFSSASRKRAIQKH